MNQTHAPRAHRHPLPTIGQKDIEAARRRTCENYHLPPENNQLANWYIEEIQDPHIAARLQDLYKDRKQTYKQQGIFFAVKLKLTKPGSDDEDRMHVDYWHNPLKELYKRILTLYDERVKHIQEMGVSRISLWSEWYQQCIKLDCHRNEHIIAACKSTIVFMEEDYVKRKLDFVTEVYALLEKHDPVHAKMLLDDLVALWPWTKANFVMQLENLVAGYDKVERVNAMIERFGLTPTLHPAYVEIVRLLQERVKELAHEVDHLRGLRIALNGEMGKGVPGRNEGLVDGYVNAYKVVQKQFRETAINYGAEFFSLLDRVSPEEAKVIVDEQKACTEDAELHELIAERRKERGI